MRMEDRPGWPVQPEDPSDGDPRPGGQRAGNGRPGNPRSGRSRPFPPTPIDPVRSPIPPDDPRRVPPGSDGDGRRYRRSGNPWPEPSRPANPWPERPRPASPERPRPANPEQIRPASPERPRPANPWPERPRPASPERRRPANPWPDRSRSAGPRIGNPPWGDAEPGDSTRLDIAGLDRTRVDMPKLEEKAIGKPSFEKLRLDGPGTAGGRRGGSGQGPSGPGGSRPGGPSRGGPTRKPSLIVGVLAGVLVLAVGAVALAARGSSHGGAQAVTAAKATVGVSTSASASASRSTAKASAKATTKASAKATATKSKSTPTASSAPPAMAPLSIPAGWTQTLDAGFSGSSLDTSLWSTCYYFSTSAGCTNNPSTEKEWYVPSQVQVSGGVLSLVAKQEATEGVNPSTEAAEQYSCRSGMVSSAPGFNFTYGLITVTAKVPYGPGLWPALWLAASNHDWPPELDIMEHWHSESQVKVYDHTVGTKYIGGAVPTPGDVSDGFHTYSLLWTKSSVTWYIDGAAVYSTTSYVPQQSMYFIANVADDSTAAGACDGTMEIQSVNVWQPR